MSCLADSLSCPPLRLLLTACMQVVIELVLATDMKQHFSILSHFTTVHRLNAGGAMTPGTSTSDPLRQPDRCVHVLCLLAAGRLAHMCKP